MLLMVAGLTAVVRAQQPAQQPARLPMFVVVYERGAAWDDAKGAFQQASIPEHMQFLRTLGEPLVGAGPFRQGVAPGTADRVVGMVIVRAASQEEAQALIARDPGIVSNVMKATVRSWMTEGLRGCN